MEYKFILLIIAIVIVIAFGHPQTSDLPSEAKPKNNLKGKISLIDNVGTARRLFPGATFTKLDKNLRSGKGSIVYTLGRRSGGDRVVATDSDRGEWGSEKDIQVLIEYPARGRGDIVTYVAVIVEQSSNVGDAYVVSGGIGQRNIGFIIEAKGSSYINYDAFIYGKP
ncbi:uncharacterized protein LOC129619100 [Condylostylus longicornis]|uniref:uncharacterized protein LOC129619100 n=1 Tax=Condylostylus longicornis TaxID=2530218 RepID=UPI00244E1BFE|nr:uncharacterized protein LOC129619100 [Condylostylus longicornis]